jgi:hypothetical protein
MNTHLTPALVSAPSCDGSGRSAVVKARAPARSHASESAPGAADAMFELAHGQVLTLQGRPGQTLQVLTGRIWLTQTGDTGDHFIAAGQRHTLRAAGRVVIEGDSLASARWRWDNRAHETLPSALFPGLRRSP